MHNDLEEVINQTLNDGIIDENVDDDAIVAEGDDVNFNEDEVDDKVEENEV